MAEVAERLQVSLWTVYRKVESGEIPAVKLGTGKRSPVRIDPVELDAGGRGSVPVRARLVAHATLDLAAEVAA